MTKHRRSDISDAGEVSKFSCSPPGGRSSLHQCIHTTLDFLGLTAIVQGLLKETAF